MNSGDINVGGDIRSVFKSLRDRLRESIRWKIIRELRESLAMELLDSANVDVKVVDRVDTSDRCGFKVVYDGELTEEQLLKVKQVLDKFGARKI